MGSDQLGFGDDDIQQTVVRFKRHVVNLLGRIGETDGQNRVLRLQCGDGAVEMAFAIADPASSAVEGREGNEKCRGKDFGRIGPWLAHAKSALDQGIARLPEPKAQMGMDDLRERDLLAAGDKRLHERARIDLAADRPIGSDA